MPIVDHDDVFAEALRTRALEDEICARLLAQAQVLRRDLSQRAYLANLAPTDFLALRYMIRSAYRASPGELARALACSPSNATKIIHRLERAGYIRASVDARSPKWKSLSVTNEGRAAYARAHRRLDPVDRFTRLSEAERKDLYRLLGLMGARGPEQPTVD